MYALWRQKMLKWLKNAWPWKKKPTKTEIYEQVVSAFNVEYEKKKPAVKRKPAAKNTVWPKDFKAEDVSKALDKQAPKPQEKTMATKPGLYANIHAKRERIAAGSGEKMRKAGAKDAPTAKEFKMAAKTAKGKK
jgi:hypothetical protein